LEPAPSCQCGEKAVAPSQNGNNRSEIIARLQGMEDLIIEDITLDETQARVTLMKVPDTPGLAAQVFDEIAEEGIVVDMIVQSVGRGGFANLSFTVPQTDLKKALETASRLAEGFGSPAPSHCPAVAKLSVTGVGMRSHTGVAARLFQSLASVGINVDMINTSEVRVNVVVGGAQGKKALETLKKEFESLMV
jgi:aspartate kinase